MARHSYTAGFDTSNYLAGGKTDNKKIYVIIPAFGCTEACKV
jgi:hypothetical protein